MIKIADVITMSHLLNEELPENNLKYLTKFYLKREVMKYEDAIKYGTNSKEFYDYATADAINTYDLFRLFSPQLEEEGLHHLAYDIEFPFSYVLAELAINGIKADRERAKEMYYEVRHLYYQLEDEMLKLFDKKYEVGITTRGRKVFAKPQINMNSGQQVVKCLQELGIKLTEKTKKGQMSTTTNTLKKLKNDIERKLNVTKK